MTQIAWTHEALPTILTAIPKQAKSLVDIECGRGIIGALCRIYRKPTRIEGLDVFEPSLDFCKQYKFYDELLRWNLEELPLPFRNKEFAVATCIELIEHLPLDVGENLLGELERIAERVIVTTPNFFFQQDE